MPAECTFVLPNGNKCRCLANRGHNLCRHHGAAPPVRSTRPRTDRDADRTYWREMGETIRGRYPDDYPTRMLDLLDALRENRISDRAAGRLLRGLLQLHNPKETPLMSSPDAIGQPAPSASPKSGPPQPAVAALLPPSLRSFASVLPPFSTPNLLASHYQLCNKSSGSMRSSRTSARCSMA